MKTSPIASWSHKTKILWIIHYSQTDALEKKRIPPSVRTNYVQAQRSKAKKSLNKIEYQYLILLKTNIRSFKSVKLQHGQYYNKDLKPILS